MSEDDRSSDRPGTSTGRATQVRDGGMARTAPAPRGNGERTQRVPTAGAAAATAGRGGTRPTSAEARRRQSQVSAQPRRRTGPRKVRLTVRSVDPWSVMKVSFLVSVALGIAFVVAVAALWGVLSQMDVFSMVNGWIQQITAGEDGASQFNLLQEFSFGRVVSIAMVIGVIDVFLITALATLTAILYNVCAALVGGFHLTLSDE